MLGADEYSGKGSAMEAPSGQSNPRCAHEPSEIVELAVSTVRQWFSMFSWSALQTLQRGSSDDVTRGCRFEIRVSFSRMHT